MSSAGRVSVTATFFSGLAPVFVRLMVNANGWPGWLADGLTVLFDSSKPLPSTGAATGGLAAAVGGASQDRATRGRAPSATAKSKNLKRVNIGGSFPSHSASNVMPHTRPEDLPLPAV